MPEVQKLLDSIKGLSIEDKVKLGVEMVKGLTMVEISQWVKMMEEEFGVTAAAPVAVAAVAAAAGAAGAAPAAVAEEPTEFTVMLVSSGEKKIQVIKVVREITNLGLKEAKDLVDNPPKPVKENLPKEEAETIKKKLEEAGAVVELKS